MDINLYVATLDSCVETRVDILKISKELNIKDTSDLESIQKELDELEREAVGIKLSIKDKVLKHQAIRDEYQNLFEKLGKLKGGLPGLVTRTMVAFDITRY